MVTAYRGHLRTLFFLPGIISLFIMCIGIIRNNSLVGRRARAESNPATERVTLYCTRRPSVLITRPQEQVSPPSAALRGVLGVLQHPGPQFWGPQLVGVVSWL